MTLRRRIFLCGARSAPQRENSPLGEKQTPQYFTGRLGSFISRVTKPAAILSAESFSRNRKISRRPFRPANQPHPVDHSRQPTSSRQTTSSRRASPVSRNIPCFPYAACLWYASAVAIGALFATTRLVSSVARRFDCGGPYQPPTNDAIDIARLVG